VQRKKIEELAKETNSFLIQMSNQSGEGIQDVRAKACDILLDHRLTQKAKDPKKAEAIMQKLHVAEPKKRDNKVREIAIPQTVVDGVKKTGPTIKELQEEFGGAGKFYIPEEEHYLLEKEEWRYDKWPEFYLGKNVADFYDADIEAKLNALEEEEDKIIQMEQQAKAMAESSEDEDGVTKDDLDGAIKKVRGKITVLKMRHKLKSKQRAKSKIKDLGEMVEDLEDRGIKVNADSLASRVKNPKRIADLEEAQDKKAKEQLGLSSDSDDDERDVEVDEALREEEGEKRGRKGKEDKKKPKKLLGKRKRNADSDEEMSIDEDDKSGID
jgi:nucleolar GTP-binding protein